LLNDYFWQEVKTTPKVREVAWGSLESKTQTFHFKITIQPSVFKKETP